MDEPDARRRDRLRVVGEVPPLDSRDLLHEVEVHDEVRVAAVQVDIAAERPSFLAGRHLNVCYRCDTRQGFPSKAKTAHVHKVVDGAYLAGGIALEGEFYLGSGDSATVVGYTDEVDAAPPALDVNLGRVGIQGVLDEFFHDR